MNAWKSSRRRVIAVSEDETEYVCTRCGTEAIETKPPYVVGHVCPNEECDNIDGPGFVVKGESDE